MEVDLTYEVPVASSSRLSEPEPLPHHPHREAAVPLGTWSFLADGGDGEKKKKPAKPPQPLKKPQIALNLAPRFAAHTLDFQPQQIKPEDEPFYKSPADSGVIAGALAKSRHKWTNGGVLQRFSSSSKSKAGKPIWQPPHNLAAMGKFLVQIGPHLFSDTTVWEVKWAPGQHAPPHAAPPRPAHSNPTPSSKPLSAPAAPGRPHSVPKPALLAPTAGPTAPKAAPAPAGPKAISPDLISHLSRKAMSDPALTAILRAAAAGTATPGELQALQSRVTEIEQQMAATSPTSAGNASPSESRSGPQQISIMKSSLPPPVSVQKPFGSSHSPTGHASPSLSAPLSGPSASKPHPAPSAYYPGMPRPQTSPTNAAQAKPGAYYPGKSPPRPQASASAGTSAAPRSAAAAAPSTTTNLFIKPPAKPTGPIRPPSLILEFKENAGERWIVPDLFAIESISQPSPRGELVLSFYVVPPAQLDARGRPLPSPPAVKCELRLKDLSPFSYDALKAVGKTVPEWKRRQAWESFEMVTPPVLYLQPRLPHPPDSPAYIKAVEARRAEELKRKGATASALLPMLPGQPPIKKKKTYKSRTISALKAPKGLKKHKATKEGSQKSLEPIKGENDSAAPSPSGDSATPVATPLAETVPPRPEPSATMEGVQT